MKNMHCNKMGADSLAENTPKCPRTYLPNLSAQVQKFWISMKIAVRSPCLYVKVGRDLIF